MNKYQYIARWNRRGTSQVVSSYGIKPADNPMELSQQLAFVVAKGGEEALTKMAEIHPDFSLIERTIVSSAQDTKPKHSNACGCGGNNFSGVDGQNAKAEVKSRMTDKSELLLTGGLILLGLAMILKISK